MVHVGFDRLQPNCYRWPRQQCQHAGTTDAYARRVQNKFGSHFGPEPHHIGGGPEAVHQQLHEHAVGRMIARVFLGDAEPEKSPFPEDCPPDGFFRGEYLVFEFTDRTSLMIEVAGGNSFSVHGDAMAKKQLARYRKP
jgi:hypothetical protein